MKMFFGSIKHNHEYEISVFARGLNSTMKMSMGFSWLESVPAGNPYSRSEFKYIEFFCTIYFLSCINNEQHFGL